MAKNLMHMLAEGPVLGDGGTFLEANWRGYDVPEIVGTHPEALRQIHRDFYHAGLQVLQALTWFTSARVGCTTQLKGEDLTPEPDFAESGRLHVTFRRGKGVQLRKQNYTVHCWVNEALRPLILQLLARPKAEFLWPAASAAARPIIKP